MNVTISLGGCEVEVSGSYYKGHDGCMYGDAPYPPEPEIFEIDTVVVDGVYITEVLEALDINWGIISDKCIQAVHDKEDNAKEEHAIEQYEWKMFEEKQMFEDHAYCGY